MANYTATVSSTRPPDEVFAYLADFRSVAEWDPSVRSAVHVNGGDPIERRGDLPRDRSRPR